MPYRYWRYMNTFGAADTDANASSEYLQFPPLHPMLLKKYEFQFSADFVTSAAVYLEPILCWVDPVSGALIDVIEQDQMVIATTFTGVGFFNESFSHDYGDEGKLCYPPPTGTAVVGMVNAGGNYNPAVLTSFSIVYRLEYEVDIDYRYLSLASINSA